MDFYEIIMTPDALDNLTELCDYITDVLLVPDTALPCICAIREEINKLSEMPESNKTVDDEPWHSRGIREIMAKNFYIYYRIDEDSKRVYILNIIYTKRDQLRRLAQMKFD